jgi:uncharacterized membrane protein (DUF106 family)
VAKIEDSDACGIQKSIKEFQKQIKALSKQISESFLKKIE